MAPEKLVVAGTETATGPTAEEYIDIIRELLDGLKSAAHTIRELQTALEARYANR